MPYRLFLPTPLLSVASEATAPGAPFRLPIPDEEAHHLTRVLRLNGGAPVEALDGAGHTYFGTLTEVTKRGAALLVARQTLTSAPAPALHLLVAPTKNLDRLEWLLEKATELGLARLTPILTQRAERRELKLDRLRKIAIAALKQSGGAWLPALDELTPLATALADASTAEAKFVAHLTADPAERQPLTVPPGTASVAVLIGPEGDFTEAEVAQARAGGFAPVTLGATVLRTETAALYATALVRAAGAA